MLYKYKTFAAMAALALVCSVGPDDACGREVLNSTAATLGEHESVNVPPAPGQRWMREVSARKRSLPEGDGPVVRRDDLPAPTSGLWDDKIAIEVGHGRTWRNTYWTWQREDWFPGDHLYSSIEDLNTARMVNRWLLGYLRNAGGSVYPDRCSDEQTNEVICDFATTATAPHSSMGTWYSRIGTSAYGGSFLYTEAVNSTTPTATIQVRATIPESGYYGVTVWYPIMAFAATDAQFVVIDAAGYRHSFRVDQTRDTGRWVPVEKFYFEAGTDVLIMEVTNKSAQPGRIVLVDCVRLGGGMGTADFGGGVSGLPRWQENPVAWLKYAGAPEWCWSASLNESNDTLTRFDYAAWQGADLLLRLHTNGSVYHTGFGTETFLHPLDQAGLARMSTVHSRIINSIRQNYRQSWVDRGIKSTEPSLWPFPFILVEVGFHDWLTDTEALMDADFRRAAMRGVYEGFLDYFSNGTGVYSPEPPESFSVRNIGSDMVRADWTTATMGGVAETYRIYYSQHPYCFKDYIAVTSNTLSAEIGPLMPGEPYFFQCRALNSGGISFPSETLAAMVSPATEAKAVLLVNGFDRFDWDIDETDNKRNYSFQHATAVDEAATSLGLAFYIDSASNEAVVRPDFSVASYSVIDWMLGQEGGTHKTLDTDEQGVIANYAQWGTGVLVLSGTDVAMDLGVNGTLQDQQFLSEFLRASYSDTVADPAEIAATENGVFDGIDLTLNPGGERYRVLRSDVIEPVGALPVYSYSGSGLTAGIQFEDSQDVLFYFAFPLEAIDSEDDRRAVMEKILPFAPDRSRVTSWSLY